MHRLDDAVLVATGFAAGIEAGSSTKSRAAVSRSPGSVRVTSADGAAAVTVRADDRGFVVALHRGDVVVGSWRTSDLGRLALILRGAYRQGTRRASGVGSGRGLVEQVRRLDEELMRLA